ncbi:MAG TPA: DNA-formamidopyrimidine glycosylase family protein, partial [Casimicrobiaceae bacterium]|nr:DNA-formamidopyrimidine glycosylase family protein [Casimicrobiaceae bacterium]
MPELPDITVYREALAKHVRGQVLERVRIVNPFVLRTAEPPLITVEGLRVLDVRRLGKRIVLGLAN